MSTDTAEFTFARRFTITPAELWHLLTDAEMRQHWNAPAEGQVLTLTQSSFEVGGTERHICGSAEAPEFEVETRWYRIEAPTDAVFTETVEAGGERIATSLVTYRVSEKDTGTDLSVTVAVSSFVGPDAAGDFRDGWESALTNLEMLAARNYSGA
jgi:uncharacterized protein YndB with AHSA1/START domain